MWPFAPLSSLGEENHFVKLLNFLILSVLFLSGCTTTKISLHTSPPGAEVYARAVGDKDLVLLGKTPLFITNQNLDKKNNGSGAVYVEFRKDGYKSDSVYITEVSRVDLIIQREMQPKRDLEYQTWLNSHIDEMFEARRLAQSGYNDEALKIIERLKEQTPMVSALYEMEGGILMLKGHYQAALNAYRMAVKYDPESTDSVKMVRYLESTFGFKREVDMSDTRMPASRLPIQEEHK